MAEQHTIAWLASATPEQIAAAQKAGELISVLGGRTAEQQAEVQRVATAKERMLAGAYGMTPGQMGVTIKDSTQLAGLRDAMPENLRALLGQIQSATSEAVAAAETSGYLKPIQDLLSGLD